MGNFRNKSYGFKAPGFSSFLLMSIRSTRENSNSQETFIAGGGKKKGKATQNDDEDVEDE